MYDGDPYMPSNGTEGMIFMSEYCDGCMHCHPDTDKQPQCEILFDSMAMDKQDFHAKHGAWIYIAGGATCTKFISWNWGDGPDWNEPEPPPPPEDPDQLVMPFLLWEILGDDIVATKYAITEA